VTRTADGYEFDEEGYEPALHPAVLGPIASANDPNPFMLHMKYDKPIFAESHSRDLETLGITMTDILAGLSDTGLSGQNG